MSINGGMPLGFVGHVGRRDCKRTQGSLLGFWFFIDGFLQSQLWGLRVQGLETEDLRFRCARSRPLRGSEDPTAWKYNSTAG